MSKPSTYAKRRAIHVDEPVDDDQEPELESPDTSGIDQVIAEASAIAPGLTGQLAWVNQRCVAGGAHEFDQVWATNFSKFFESGKQEMVMLGGLRSGKTSSALRAIVPVAMLSRHNLEQGETGIFPVVSCRLDLATLVLGDIERILLCCGVAPARRGDERQAMPGGIGGTFLMSKSTGGGGTIDFASPYGYNIKIRCMAARFNSVVAYTSVGGFVDEIDQYPEGPDAASSGTEILDGLRQRSTTTRKTARTFLSSSYYPDKERSRGGHGAFRKLVTEGDTPIQYLARLGNVGATRDQEARQELAKVLGSSDPRLLEPGDPNSPAIPTWATRLDIEIANLLRDEKGDLGRLMCAFGARFDGGKGTTDDAEARARHLMACNAHLSSRGRSVMTMNGPVKVSEDIPSNARGHVNANGLISGSHNLSLSDPRHPRNRGTGGDDGRGRNCL